VRSGLQTVSDVNFDRVVAESAAPVLVEFWKPGCGHCRALTTELEHVQQKAGSGLLILTMNVEENPQTPAELEITSLPALALYRNGEFARFIGGLGTRDEILRQIGHESGN
jgi:thioredoxin-like negative regulator of GroEL